MLSAVAQVFQHKLLSFWAIWAVGKSRSHRVQDLQSADTRIKMIGNGDPSYLPDTWPLLDRSDSPYRTLDSFFQDVFRRIAHVTWRQSVGKILANPKDRLIASVESVQQPCLSRLTSYKTVRSRCPRHWLHARLQIRSQSRNSVEGPGGTYG